MLKIPSERDLNIIRGKMMVNAATQKELLDFLTFVTKLESLVEEASMEDFYGTEGWQKRMGWD